VSVLLREPVQPDGLAPVKALQRTDGVYIVYDPALPFGKRTASTWRTLASAIDAAWIQRGLYPRE
jgi:hypothetical protein